MHLEKDRVEANDPRQPLPQDPPSISTIASRPVDKPHQLAMRQKARQRQQQSLFYLGSILEHWAIACQKAHTAGYLLACAIRMRSTMRGGEAVPVSQALADHLGISRDGRKRAFAALEAAGLIVCKPAAAAPSTKTASGVMSPAGIPSGSSRRPRTSSAGAQGFIADDTG